jgi:SAM-dependent methyltransferase
MLDWWERWGLHPEICPCDVHFNEWVEAQGISNKLIYHFGTGTHHVIGRRQAELGAGNVVVAITASKAEYEDYVSLVIDSPAVAKSYLAYFGDIYLTNPRFLPDFDVVNLFHLCEFFRPEKMPQYGGIDDRELLDAFTAKTRPGGYLLFFSGSKDFDKAQPVIAAWEKKWPVERLDDFKSLRIYRKTA